LKITGFQVPRARVGRGNKARSCAYPSSYKVIQLRKTLLVMRNDELVRTFVQLGGFLLRQMGA
jgi:hypothetical protein